MLFRAFLFTLLASSTLATSGKNPEGAPSEISVEALSQDTLVVYWKPPEKSLWNGDIRGYNVGYKQSNTDELYRFETVELRTEQEGKEHHLKIYNLQTYTQYSVVVQAFNTEGAGPTSDEYEAYTGEGVPEQPPDLASCTTLTALTIYVSWVSPPLSSANGVIRGFKVIYGPSDTWFDENTKDSKITSSSETILHGLKPYTNYSMEILAFTYVGDGVRTTPIACQTEQDIPEAPTQVKLVISCDAILLSWGPPINPNGIIEYYMVYYKVAESNDNPKWQKVIPDLNNRNLMFQVKGLDSNLKYEFWVRATTMVGDGVTSVKLSTAPRSCDSSKDSLDYDNSTIERETRLQYTSQNQCCQMVPC